MAESVDPDHTPRLRRLIWVNNICSGLSVRILRVTTVFLTVWLSELQDKGRENNEAAHGKTYSKTYETAKTQISLYIHPVWQGFSFIPLWITRRLYKAYAICKDWSDCWMNKLIWVFAGRTSLIVGFYARWLKCNFWKMQIEVVWWMKRSLDQTVVIKCL